MRQGLWRCWLGQWSKKEARAQGLGHWDPLPQNPAGGVLSNQGRSVVGEG